MEALKHIVVIEIVIALAACGQGTGPGAASHDAPPAETDASPPHDGMLAVDAALCPATALAPGDTTKAIMVGGTQRTYHVHVPPAYRGSTPVPLVIDLHPKDVTAASWITSTPWNSVADAEGFIIVRPDGYEKTWNVGRCCSPAMEAVDDVAFVRAMVAALEQDACIDAKRIYATGCSNGGGMAYKLACDAADLIAAIAPVDFDCITGPTSSPSCASCAPSRPISETQIRGVLDPLVPYFGGDTTVVPGLRFPGAQTNFETWGMLNQCTGQPQTDPWNASCKTYPTCGGGVETTLCTNPVGLHCTDYASFHIAEIAWGMFSRQHLP